MTRHFRPDSVVRGRFGGRGRRRWTDPRDYPGSSRGGRLSASTAGIVLAAAIGVGLAVGLGGSEPPAAPAATSDKPILWNETQPVPKAAPAPEDAAWAAGGSPVVAAEMTPAEQAASANIPFFGYCHTGGGANCVVDGDTFYFGRDKVRIANIDAPETHPPRCASEARLGAAATHRLRDLLNSGQVTLHTVDRDEDPYGRKLRNVAVGGADVGAVLVAEGLARHYGGRREPWCAG